MRIVNRRVTSNYKHKKCKTRTTNIKITTTRKVITIVAKRKEKENNNQYEDCDQEGHE